MKKLKTIHPSPPGHWVGDGFPVRSVFMYDGWGRELSPFLLLDYAAPAKFPPAKAKLGVGEHPHRGFETVTIVYQGSLAHRDSSGGGGTIGPGDVQWMTAGSGLVHEEFHSPQFAREGGTLEMAQLWVNLPAKDKKAPPGYQAILASDIPEEKLGEGASARVIAGRLGAAAGPARTFTPIHIWDVRAAAAGRIDLPAPEGFTTAVFILRGEAKIEGRAAGAGELAVFSREGAGLELETSAGLAALVLSGEPILEPVAGMGPFVMNTREEIAQAIADYQAGRMGALSG